MDRMAWPGPARLAQRTLPQHGPEHASRAQRQAERAFREASASQDAKTALARSCRIRKVSGRM